MLFIRAPDIVPFFSAGPPSSQHRRTLSLAHPSPTNRPSTMVKEKNHTNRNQSFKAHRRGIKKVKPQRYRSLRGVSCS